MTRARQRNILRTLALLLIAAGFFFLYRGGRELILPWLHQKQAARQWHAPKPPAPTASIPNSIPKRLPPTRLNHSLFHRGDTVAHLSIPRLNGDWYVVEGTAHNELRLGPGHLTGTAFPGESGNCVIAGHRDTQFRVLRNIQRGDEIVLSTSIGESRYRVTGYDIVRPTDTRSLRATRHPVLNLVTCYPFYYLGNAPKRFIVHAELIGTELAGR
jgi:sortase A